MTGNVIDLPVITKLDLPPERIIEAASKAELESVVIVGFTAEGGEYFASSLADGGDVLWLLERAKLRLLTVGDEQ